MWEVKGGRFPFQTPIPDSCVILLRFPDSCVNVNLLLFPFQIPVLGCTQSAVLSGKPQMAVMDPPQELAYVMQYVKPSTTAVLIKTKFALKVQILHDL